MAMNQIMMTMTTRTKKIAISEYPHVEVDLAPSREPSLSYMSTRARKSDGETSQCRMPDTTSRGTLYAYGLCNRYVERCFPVGEVTRNAFR